MAKDIVELKNNNGTIVYPKTTGEAVYLVDGDTLQTFLNALHNALKYNIIPAEDGVITIGKSGKQIKELHVAKVIVSDSIDAAGKSLQVGNITASSISASSGITGTLTGGVNADGENTKVYGAVFN